MPHRLARGFRSGFVALVLASGALLLFFLHYDYQRTMREGEVHLTHVAELFNEHFLGSLELATLRAETMTNRLAGFNLYRVPALEAEHGEGLRSFVENVEQIAAMVVIDHEGAVRWSSIDGVLGLYLNDRDYFQGTLEGGGNGYIVGAPLDSPITGMRVTPIAWPIRAEDGSVLGVMASSLEASYFRRLLEETRFDPAMSLDIRAEDGTAAFISEGAEVSQEGRLISVSAPIPGTGLKTVLALPRPVVIRSFVLRAVAFTAVFALISGLALYAALLAHRRMLALRSSLAQIEREAWKSKRAAKQFQAIFQNVDDGIIVFDALGEFRTSNRRAQELFGVDSAGAAVERFRASAPMELDKLVDSTSFIFVPDAGGRAGVIGREIRCRVSFVEEVEGHTLYCVLTDVSAEERLIRARTAFVETVNHELRTPLTSLNGAMRLLTSRFGADLPPKARQLLDLAERNASRLLMLVNDILTLQAMDQGRLDVTLETIRANDIAREAVTNMQGYADGFGVGLMLELQNTGASVQVDPIRMQQVMDNLISNAVKYSPKGESVEVSSVLDEGEVVIRVRDHGPGIPAAAQSAIFERFAKPVHGPDTQASGTGLGLAISRELVERMGGTLSLESIHQDEAGGDRAHGSTFIVRLPLAQMDQRSAAE
ncbi:PAS domain-containing protein [Salipiger bermudensis]|uniref:ATP-binding protein n=1 Tax=Salipiger bermudensis TaxID=344736 RepID=UPI001C9992B7|nr:ATP-binding protein [Salipiger bermudensis]MBY6002699.1 PAS domain-containing protein [Salipiger bermudensis]